MLSNEEAQAKIDAMPYPKVTLDRIKSKIDVVGYTVLENSTVTICNITMKNGFSIRGESACVDPRNFDKAVGQKYAYEDAISKIWVLEGYLLKEEIYRSDLK